MNLSTDPRPRPGRTRRGRRAFGVLACVAAATVTAACGTGQKANSANASASFSPKTLTIVNTSAAGGGADTAVRRLQPFLQKAIGVPVSVTDQEGGQGLPALKALAQRGADCSHMVMTAVPQLNYIPLVTGTDFRPGDIYPVASVTNQPVVISVRSDSSYKTLSDLVSAAKASPGKITVSVSQVASPQYIAMYQLEKATGAKFNVVQFGGGGPASNALLGGQVDAMAGPGADVDKLGDKAVVLAAFTDPKNSQDAGGAPSVDQELKVKVPTSYSYYALFVDNACHKQKASDYKALVQAVQKAGTSAGYVDALKKANAERYGKILAGSDFVAIVNEQEKNVEQVHADNPKIFAGGK